MSRCARAELARKLDVDYSPAPARKLLEKREPNCSFTVGVTLLRRGVLMIAAASLAHHHQHRSFASRRVAPRLASMTALSRQCHRTPELGLKSVLFNGRLVCRCFHGVFVQFSSSLTSKEFLLAEGSEDANPGLGSYSSRERNLQWNVHTCYLVSLFLTRVFVL